jgi:hypothetical protein
MRSGLFKRFPKTFSGRPKIGLFKREALTQVKKTALARPAQVHSPPDQAKQLAQS